MPKGVNQALFPFIKVHPQWLAETFEGHDTADDELSGSININDDIHQPSLLNFPLSLEPLEPYVGMEFESAEDAREFYELYGRRMGFTIRNNRTRRSLKDNSIIGREFVCSKEGFRSQKHVNNRGLPSQPATREGCNAMLRIAAKEGGKWVIYAFVKEHNHELNPSKIPSRRSHRIALCEKKISAAYQEKLQTILRYIEEHTQRLSINVAAVFSNVRELEAEELDDLDSYE
ncbi:protein FAR1-RELATED SEQUENCE 5-like [Lycium ferocissimum]|uniref:protein FAR1-RELATED SEQUENCE 5-like n=1 Tax=Lycium ferocissimum TaxID=112874 RepID=UPI00281537DF|nr:protein FAR1-RELATED SEQUENCE 5-like [Lycium ferocissimum]